MPFKVDEIEGIDPAHRDRLFMVSIRTTHDLLERCGTTESRQEVALRTGIDEQRLLKWANTADLMRIAGIGRLNAELLEASGVDTIEKLRDRHPDRLAARIKSVNTKRRLARLSPTETVVARWVEQAKRVRAKITL